jgi:hypothetical protein
LGMPSGASGKLRGEWFPRSHTDAVSSPASGSSLSRRRDWIAKRAAELSPRDEPTLGSRIAAEREYVNLTPSEAGLTVAQVLEANDEQRR